MVLRYWRDQAKFHNHIVSFIVTAPVVLKDLASLLEDLTSQVELSALLLDSYTHTCMQ